MKKALLLTLVAALSACVHANEVWWMEPGDDPADGWDGAKLRYPTASSLGRNGGTAASEAYTKAQLENADLPLLAGDGACSSAHSFLVELSRAREWQTASASAYQFSGFFTTVAPEPTSALLLLWGLAGLALQRKKIFENTPLRRLRAF